MNPLASPLLTVLPIISSSPVLSCSILPYPIGTSVFSNTFTFFCFCFCDFCCLCMLCLFVVVWLPTASTNQCQMTATGTTYHNLMNPIKPTTAPNIPTQPDPTYQFLTKVMMGPHTKIQFLHNSVTRFRKPKPILKPLQLPLL